MLVSISWSSDDKMLASANYVGKRVRLWNFERNSSLLSPHCFPSAIQSVSWIPDERGLLMVEQFGNLWIVNTKTGQKISCYKKPFNSVKWLSDGRLLGVQSCGDMIFVCNIHSEDKLCLCDNPNGKGFLNKTALSNDGNLLASSKQGYNVEVWNIESQELLYLFENRKDSITDLQFSHDNRYLAVGDIKGNICVWNLTTGKKQHIFSIPSSNWISVCFSYDDQLLACLSGEETYLFDLANGKQRYVVKGHTGYFSNITFSHDGRFLVLGGKDNIIRFWNVQTGKLLKELQGHTNFVLGVAFSPDDKFLATTESNTIRIWDIATGKVIRIIGGHGLVLENADFRGAKDIVPIYKKLIKQRGGMVDV